MSKKKERKPLALPFLVQFPDKTVKSIEFPYIPKKVGSKFTLDTEKGKAEYKIKSFDGPVLVVVKVKQLTEKEKQEKEEKRLKEAHDFFWGGIPTLAAPERPEEEEAPPAPVPLRSAHVRLKKLKREGIQKLKKAKKTTFNYFIYIDGVFAAAYSTVRQLPTPQPGVSTIG